MVSLQDVEPGTRLRLTDGTVVTVTDNPRDGIWIIASREGAAGSDDMVHCDDVREIVAAGAAS